VNLSPAKLKQFEALWQAKELASRARRSFNPPELAAQAKLMDFRHWAREAKEVPMQERHRQLAVQRPKAKATSSPTATIPASLRS
jgi:hypothetical protein